MKQSPTRTKYRKEQRGSLSGNAQVGNMLEYGEYGLKALNRGLLSAKELEAIRVAISRELKRKGTVTIRLFPHTPYTKKPLETRQGTGKGGIEHYVARTRPGAVIVEVGNVSAEEAKIALAKASGKLSVKTKFVQRLETV